MKESYKNDALFIMSNLPEPLEEEKLNLLFIKIKNGDKNAFDDVVIHNIRLVISRVTRKFSSVVYDKEDLVSIGNIGLMKAIYSYDITKNVKFNTYAVMCIDNEIRLFLRKIKHDKYNDSIDETLVYSKYEEIFLKDFLKDEFDIEEDYMTKELYLFIDKILFEFSEFDREILMMFFGFYNNKFYIQKEIGNKFGYTQSYISRRISFLLDRIKFLLEINDFVPKKKIRTIN